jgi:hypothetical protein
VNPDHFPKSKFRENDGLKDFAYIELDQIMRLVAGPSQNSNYIEGNFEERKRIAKVIDLNSHIQFKYA